jgi:hypothetical protein
MLSNNKCYQTTLQGQSNHTENSELELPVGV